MPLQVQIQSCFPYSEPVEEDPEVEPTEQRFVAGEELVVVLWAEPQTPFWDTATVTVAFCGPVDPPGPEQLSV